MRSKSWDARVEGGASAESPSTDRRRHFGVALLAPIILVIASQVCIEGSAWSHGKVGNHVFLSPVSSNDAFPDNVAGIFARHGSGDSVLGPAVEKQLSDNLSLLVATEWDRRSRAAQPPETGFKDLSIFVRQAIFTSARHETKLTLSPILVLPSGNSEVGAGKQTQLGGELLFAKGMGDLPGADGMRLLRPLALQIGLRTTSAVAGSETTPLFFAVETEYSFSYLRRFVQGRNDLSLLDRLIPYTQFNYFEEVADRNRRRPEFTLTPGIAFLAEWFEVSAGAQVALNRPAVDQNRAAFVGLMEIFYDEIFPALSAKLF